MLRDSPGAGVATGITPLSGCRPSEVEFGEATSSASARATAGTAASATITAPISRAGRKKGILGAPKIVGRRAFLLGLGRRCTRTPVLHKNRQVTFPPWAPHGPGGFPRK